jgi:6-phosphogluconolactonase
MTETLVLDDPAGECAGRLAAAAGDGAHIALTGGSTPKLCYERLAEMDVDWAGATLWFSDERCVPPDDELSNFGMANAALIGSLPAAGDGGPAVKRMRGEEGPSAGADDYERELRETLGEEIPRLDVALLGLGPDAHVASLFPGQPTLRVTDRPVVGVPEAAMEPFVPRISLTLPVLNAARTVIFLVTGEGKAEAARRAFRSEPTDQAPGSLVRPHSGELVLLLDAAAASRL